MPENALNRFDSEISTNMNSKETFWIGMDLGKQTKISKVKYLFCNSFNSIEPGDTNELIYWDDKWQCQGWKRAKWDYLEYNVPGNLILWPRNLTWDTQEMIFIIKDGKQIWGQLW